MHEWTIGHQPLHAQLLPQVETTLYHLLLGFTVHNPENDENKHCNTGTSFFIILYVFVVFQLMHNLHIDVLSVVLLGY